MCGIFGWIGKQGTINKYKIYVLGALNEQRGTDSAGIYTGNLIIKSDQRFCLFVREKRKEIEKQMKNAKFLIGHTRNAVYGSITKPHAHPLRIGKIVGVHNGILNNFKELAKKESLNFQVDSEVLFYFIEKYGLDAFKKFFGTWALVWHNTSEPNYIYFTRYGNPLSLLILPNEIFFTSELIHLQTLYEGEGDFIELKEKILYKININTLSIKEKKIKGISPEFSFFRFEKEIEEYLPYEHIPVEEEYWWCPLCEMVIPIEEAVEEGDFLYCPYCGERLLLKKPSSEI